MAIATRKHYLYTVTLILTTVLVVSSLPVRGDLILEVGHSPEEPIPGEEVNVTLTVSDYTDVQVAELQYCTFDPYSCMNVVMKYGGNNTFWERIPGDFDDGVVVGYNIAVLNSTGHIERYLPEGQYVNVTFEGEPLARPSPTLFTLDFLLIEGLLIAIALALLGIVIWRKTKGLEVSKVSVLGVVFLIILSLVYGAFHFLTAPSEIEQAKDFGDYDTDGNLFNLSDFRGKVVILDFMSISCGGCELISDQLKIVHTNSDSSEVEIISIDISAADTIEALREFKSVKGIPWRMALNSSLKYEYSIGSLPTVVIVDKKGFAVDIITNAHTSANEFEKKIDRALEGKAQAIGIKAASAIVLAIFAGFATFFSPCSFPMLPGFVAYYLSSEVEQKKKGTSRVLASGLVAGVGIILVFVLIGVAWIVAWMAVGTQSNVEEYTPILGPIVGAVLIILGALMFTNIQYHALLRPFSKLKRTLFKGSMETSGYYAKLFAYGVGYGAAASACTAPLFIGVLVDTSVSGGPSESILVLIVFSLVIILLMVVITFMLSAFGQESVRKLSQYTDLIKKVSAVVLIVVGAYLIYYYLTTHVI